jgi:hypothetical protein
VDSRASIASDEVTNRIHVAMLTTSAFVTMTMGSTDAVVVAAAAAEDVGLDIWS